MKKLTLLILSFCLSTHYINAQWRSSSIYNGSINDLFFTDPLTGFAATQAAGIGSCASTLNIMRTIDGGENWVRMNTGSNSAMNRLHFVDQFTGWAVGANSTVLKTSDGGQTWASQTTGIGSGLNDISFGNANVGIVVGPNGFVRRSSNGGSTWTTVSSGVTTTLYSVCMVDANVGYFCGANGVIRKTTNGGTSWSSAYTGTEFFKEVWFADANNGFAITPSQIFRTTNGGSSWQSFTFDNSLLLYRMSFVSAQTGYIVADPNVILKTTDGGITWENLPAPQNAAWECTYFYDENHGFIGRSGGKIARTRNGGASWNILTSGFSGQPNDIDFINPVTGLITTNGSHLFKTLNGGLNIREIELPTNRSVNSVRYLNENIVIVAGDSGTILRSTDGGNSFTFIQTPVNSLLVELSVVNENVIYAAASNARVIKSIDGGVTWTLTTNTGAVFLRSIYFVSPDTGMVSGDDRIYRTFNGGQTWQLKNLGVDANTDLDDIWMITKDLAYAGGIFGKLYKTFDGGESWNPIFPASNTNASIDEMYWLSDSVAHFARLNSQSITLDGGVTIGSQSTYCLANNGGVDAIEMVDSVYGYCAGGISNVFHTLKPINLWRTYLQDSVYCSNSRIFVGYNAGGLLVNDNVIIAQLSDASGSFSSPVNIGSFTITNPVNDPSGIITCQLPSGLNGNGYRIRVICQNPELVGPDNGYPIRILPSYSPAVVLSGDPLAICDGAPVNLTASVSAGGLQPSYAWSVNGTPIVYGAASLTINTLTAASTVAVTVTSSLACASPNSANASVNIAVAESPSAFAGNDTLICYGDAVTIGSPSNQTIAWEPTLGLLNPNNAQTLASPETSTAYKLTVTSEEGCVGIDTVQVSVTTPLGNPSIALSGNSIVVSNASQGTYTWFLNDEPLTEANNDTLDVFAPGDYFVTIEDAFGCSVTSNTITVNTVGISNASPYSAPRFVSQSAQWKLEQVNSTALNLDIRVIDLSGKIVYQGKMTQIGAGTYGMPAQTIAQGAYFLQFNNAGSITNLKFVQP